MLFGGTIVSAVISGGTVTVGIAASFGGNLTFAGSGGVLEFETDTMPTAVITGLSPVTSSCSRTRPLGRVPPSP